LFHPTEDQGVSQLDILSEHRLVFFVATNA